MSTQLVPQSTAAPTHPAPCGLHALWSQICPDGHTTPQPPQLGLALVSTHAPLQSAVPLAHWQVPAEHVAPAGHAASQRPQCCTLVCVSTHPPPHRVRPDGHPQLD